MWTALTAQERCYVPSTEPNRLILFGETVAVYCENHTEHTDTLCGQNAVRTSQDTRYLSATEPNRLMLFGETVAVYCENSTEHTDTICGQNAVRTSQDTRYVSTTEPNRLMLFGETVAVYCENRTEYTDTLSGQNAEFLCVETGDAYINHWALTSYCCHHMKRHAVCYFRGKSLSCLRAGPCAVGEQRNPCHSGEITGFVHPILSHCNDWTAPAHSTDYFRFFINTTFCVGLGVLRGSTPCDLNVS
jgi:translation initiation factor IF-1